MKFARPIRNNSQGGPAVCSVWISNGARGFLIFSYGLFTIAAQTLFFREFITTFEGNDISVGIFFGSWFLWVGLGAILVYRVRTFAEGLLKNVEFLFLGYLPAFILQLILIIQARELAGIESYALLPIRTILLLAMVINAPVSVITGMLFPTACRWVQKDQSAKGGPVSRVYIIEAAGSFVGGLGVTILLGFGVSLARIFFVLALIVSLSVFLVQITKTSDKWFAISDKLRWLWVFVPLCVLVCLVAGVDKRLSQQLRVIKWTKLLPKEALAGSFQTAQAEYLYGNYQKQWVAIREGSTCETLPDRESAGRIAAIGLCQNPDAKRILVIGSGLGLCYEFLRLPQTEIVTWAHCDSEYVQKIEKFIPAELKIADERLHRLEGDVRSFLGEKKGYYDLAILNLPDVTSSVLNRYYTLEFYRQVKSALRPGGLLQVRVAGGENIIGTELINLGASTKLTLEKVFSKLVLTPGDDTWFIASDSEKLTGEPGTLRDRFATINGASNLFPPDALFSVYLPNRAAFALENYSRADLPQHLLINRDCRPLTHLYSLLLAAKQSGAPITRFVKLLALVGPLAFVIPILVFIALRAAYILSQKSSTSTGRLSAESWASRPPYVWRASFDSAFLVFSAGWLGIGVVIVLMYLYQTRFGSLYLHIGVISSLFMMGLTAGATLISSFLIRHCDRGSRVTPYVFAVIIVHTLILVTIVFWPDEQWTHLIFAVAFVLCGLCTGFYFPIAARQLADTGFETGQAASSLETADHLGASVGGTVTSLALVPVLGTSVTLFVFILLILANLPLAALRIYKPQKVSCLATTTFRLRRLGYILFGVGVAIILCSNLFADAAARLRPSLPQLAAQALAGELQIGQESTELCDSARKINYFRVSDANDKLAGYIFSSQDLAPEVRGFGGKMNLAIYVDTAGNLVNFHTIQSNETPAYLELLGKWNDSLKGHKLFGPEPFAEVDTVTGATVSSKAILSALQASGHKFATQVLGRSLSPLLLAQQARGPDTYGIYLISAFVLTLIVIYYGGFWSRLAVLLLNLVVGGIWLNAQYSSEQIVTLLSMQAPALGLSGVFLLVAGIPLLVIIFGNIYCGYICPFGAAQELLGFLVPERFKQPLSAEKMQKARFVKYVVLFVLVIVFFVSRDRTTLAADPLISIFNLRFTIFDFNSAVIGWQSSALLMVAVALIASVFYARFWCRYLCPVGAFLSLFNNVVILKRYLPAKRFDKCEFGLTAKDHLDCIYCDRCRYQTKDQRPKTKDLGLESLRRQRFGALATCVLGPASYLSRYLVVIVVLVGIFVSAVSVDRFFKVTRAGIGQPAVSMAAGGQPRDVDMQRIRTLIKQKRLSDREAEFYKKVE